MEEDRIEVWNGVFFGGKKNPCTYMDNTQNQTQPTFDTGSRMLMCPTLVGGKHFQHCMPSLLPLTWYKVCSTNAENTTWARIYRRMSLIQLESSRLIPYIVDVLLLINMYIFHCFTFTSTCNYCVPSHIYLYCSTEGCFGFNSATWAGFPHTISSLSAKDDEQDESQSSGERSLLHVQCIHSVCNLMVAI